MHVTKCTFSTHDFVYEKWIFLEKANSIAAHKLVQIAFLTSGQIVLKEKQSENILLKLIQQTYIYKKEAYASENYWLWN